MITIRILDKIGSDGQMNKFVLRTLESRENDIDLETLAILAKNCCKSEKRNYELISKSYNNCMKKRQRNYDDDDNFVVLSSIIQGALSEYAKEK